MKARVTRRTDLQHLTQERGEVSAQGVLKGDVCRTAVPLGPSATQVRQCDARDGTVGLSEDGASPGVSPLAHLTCARGLGDGPGGFRSRNAGQPKPQPDAPPVGGLDIPRSSVSLPTDGPRTVPKNPQGG